MILVGLTGGMGTGKSTVGRFLAEAGAQVIDTDQLAREAIAPGTPGHRRLAEAFGPAVVGGDGSIDRRALARLAFADPASTARLNAIVHPAVDGLLEDRLGVLAAAGVEVVVIEVPLLFEVGMDRRMDTVVVVTSDVEVQARRLLAAGFDPDDAQRRIDAQMPLAEKVARADLVIDNGGDIENTRSQVNTLWERLAAADG